MEASARTPRGSWRNQMDITMALCGVKSLKEIDRRVLADYDERRNSLD